MLSLSHWVPAKIFLTDPSLVDFVRSQKAQNASSSTSSSIKKCPDQSLNDRKVPAPHSPGSVPDSQEIRMDTDEEDETEPTNQHPITGEHFFGSYLLNWY